MRRREWGRRKRRRTRGGERSRGGEGSCPFFQGFGTAFEVRKMYK